jgi:hypothetical protein
MKIHSVVSWLNHRPFVTFRNLRFAVHGCFRFCSAGIRYCSLLVGQFGAFWARRSKDNVRPDQSCCFSYSDFCISINDELKPCETAALCASWSRYRGGSLWRGQSRCNAI